MSRSVLVALTIKVDVDDRYSPNEHAADIVVNARKLFSEAEVNVVQVDCGERSRESPSSRSFQIAG